MSTQIPSKYLIFQPEKKVFIVEKNSLGQMDLCSKRPSCDLELYDPICRLLDGFYVVVGITKSDPVGISIATKDMRLTIYNSKMRPTHNLFYAMKVFFIYGLFVEMSKTFDEEHKSEKDYTLKMLGLIKPIVME